jgi:hypothetical protein
MIRALLTYAGARSEVDRRRQGYLAANQELPDGEVVVHIAAAIRLRSGST